MLLLDTWLFLADIFVFVVDLAFDDLRLFVVDGTSLTGFTLRSSLLSLAVEGRWES